MSSNVNSKCTDWCFTYNVQMEESLFKAIQFFLKQAERIKDLNTSYARLNKEKMGIYTFKLLLFVK